MEKRVILAFVMSIAVMYIFTAWYAPRKAPPANPIEQSSTAIPPSTSNPASAPASSTNSPQAAATSAPEQDARAEKAEDFVVETPLYTATISNVGGLIKSY